MKILLIEDDKSTREYVQSGLQEEGHVVDVADNGKDGLLTATLYTYDVMIIDRMLPEVDGLTIVKTLRGAGNTTPIIFLTAIGGVNDRIEGLSAGSDDYLTKPFAFGELSARIAALARRPKVVAQTNTLTVHDLEVDLISRKVTRAGVEIDLLPREFTLLEHLIRTRGRVQTRTMLLEAVWDLNFDPQTNVVEAHVSRLRTKIDKPFDRELIETVRGSGYRIS